MFDDVYNNTGSAKNSFSGEVRDAFGQSICEELFDELLKGMDFTKHCSEAADAKEAAVHAMLMELRLII